MLFRKPRPRTRLMKTLYLDLFSGISGDMFIGALIDLGVDFNQLQREVAKLGVGGHHLHAARKTKAGIAGVKFDVHAEKEHEHGPAHGHHHSHDGSRECWRRRSPTARAGWIARMDGCPCPRRRRWKSSARAASR